MFYEHLRYTFEQASTAQIVGLSIFCLWLITLFISALIVVDKNEKVSSLTQENRDYRHKVYSLECELRAKNRELVFANRHSY